MKDQGEKNKRKDCTKDIVASCINKFVHSEVVTKIYTNTFKLKTIDKVKHPIRIWSNCMTHGQKHDLFKRSEMFKPCK